MYLVRLLRHPPATRTPWRAARCYVTSSTPVEAAQSSKSAPVTSKPAASTPADEEASPKSSCAEGTVLAGVQWLKGQGDVLAKADHEYPDWLWTLLQPKVLPDDGPGGLAEKTRLRKQNRQRIREQNFLKTQ